MVGKGAPKRKDATEKKLCWLRSQIIGGSAEFNTPFGRRRLTYADHTASGRCLRCIENYTSTNLLPFYGNSHTSESYVGYQTTKMMHEATNYVKKCLGGKEEDAIIFCGSGSTTAIKRLQESLAEVVEIGLDHRGQIDMEALRKNLSYYKDKNRPILGSFSACSNVTGICTNTRAVARLLHQFGGFACFDFAASGPYTKIDMRSGVMDGYDAIFLSPHKFLGGPGTPGILLMRKILYGLGSSSPSTCGGGTVNYVNNFDEKDTIYLDNIEEREDAGTPQIIQKIRAAMAFWIREYIGYEAIDNLEKSFIRRAKQRLLPNPNIWILGNTNVKRQSIFSFVIRSTSISLSSSTAAANKTRGKPLHGAFVAKLLNDLFGIQARGGCSCAGPYGHSLLNISHHRSLALRSLIQKGYVGVKPGWTRVSFPYYMSEEEFDFILAAIEFIAKYGQRFMCCYDFSWRRGDWTFKKNITALKDQYGSSPARLVKALIIELNEKQSNMKQDMVLSYAIYLETAKRIATLLPKFPPNIKIPQGIDVNLLSFMV
ncbi:hypothetical protein C2S52_016128 [Perilla frutescens var. hirtella]|nr:hypothetical protein C2S52_016128 [Perilla frutescens var. hirtella]